MVLISSWLLGNILCSVIQKVSCTISQLKEILSVMVLKYRSRYSI
jgi:hypothetical protein